MNQKIKKRVQSFFVSIAAKPNDFTARYSFKKSAMKIMMANTYNCNLPSWQNINVLLK
jgi:hypothetical protein